MKNVASQQAGFTNEGDNMPVSLTDTGNADRFVRRHGEDVRYVPQWGWMVWTGTHWARDQFKVRARMIETARAIHHEAADTSDKAVQNEISKWARNSQQGSRIKAALWFAEAALVTDIGKFDQEDMLLPVANGTINLRTGEWSPHLRDHMATRRSMVHFSAGALCPTWDAFLERVLPDIELRRFVKRLVGYTLTGSVSEQVLAFVYGRGRNGKSVFLERLSDLMGEYAIPTRIETLCPTRSGGVPNDVAALAGARLVTVSETPQGARLNESLVKDLTGEDTISARFLHREFFQFRPQFKLWIRGNHKPQIRGTDDGIWRRVLLIPFTVQIPESEIDKDLSSKLRDELPGILNWAIEGCLEWQRRGLKPPQKLQDAVEEYRAEMDSLGEFLDQRCVLAQGAKAPAGALYTAYRESCVASGEQPVSQREFGLSLSNRGFAKTKPKGVVWHGLELKSDLADLSDLSRGSSDSYTHNLNKPENGSDMVGRSDAGMPSSDLEDRRWQ